MPIVYDRFARFYDLEYSLKEDDLPFYLDLADSHGAPILEIGAGTGRVTFELSRAGHEVWGIDDSARMLAIAQKKLLNIPEEAVKKLHLIKADMRSFNLPRKFSLCIIPFRAFLHNLTQGDQLATLRTIHTHLRPDGLLALDLFVPVHQVLSQREWQLAIPAEELAEPDQGVSLTAHIQHDPAAQLLSIRNTYHQAAADGTTTESSAVMRYRYIYRFEMELLLMQCGFEIEAIYGGFSNEPYDFHSGIMCFVARKTAKGRGKQP